MTSVPLHRARASLSWIIECAATYPVTLTRNGQAVAVVVSPSTVQRGQPITSDVRSAVRADLLHALYLLDAEH
ncbi:MULTISPECIES: type II toxin-antitoxin system Phd/YefM family antitoxin [unclassified Gordonia (in: high G+C Gram-positive bacteria)]|uniref:type II toxin-antitoxin system Phd/YefM family antitoxin n=1 Tax=unclassified Gordonia (in: high G+C Gram-positive bacteria) TaxID=2657482 RepID=UPI0025C38FA2|nr:type II toxin-antitoxin system Phd/YefM family antitoxin [Gordonia sp. UBA7599]